MCLYTHLLSVRAVPILLIKQKLNYEIKIGQCNPHLKNCAVYLLVATTQEGYIFSQHPTPIAKAIKVVCTGLRNSQFAPWVSRGEKADTVTISRHIAQIVWSKTIY